MSRKALQEAARSITRAPLDPTALRAQHEAASHPPTYEDTARRLLLHGLTPNSAYDHAHLTFRRRFFSTLGHSRNRAEERRDHARDLLMQEIDLVVGWHEFLEDASGMASDFQTSQAYAWWKPGDVVAWDDERQEFAARDDAERVFRAAGYTRLGREVYLSRVKPRLLSYLLTHNRDAVLYLCRLITAFTMDRVRITPHVLENPDEFEAEAVKELSIVEYRLGRGPAYVALPRQPLATMPGEANALGLVASGANVEGAKITPHRDTKTGQLSLLSYIPKLVARERDRSPTYLKIPVDPALASSIDDPLVLLLQSLTGLAEKNDTVRHSALQDIPRVVAGMFQAATHDAELGLDRIPPGHFLEAESGVRITEIIGLKKNFNSHVQRVREVRDWLATIKLVREIPVWNKKKKKFVKGEWEAPLVQRLQDTFTLSTLGDEVPMVLRRARSPLHMWRINPDLWSMRTPDSGNASFMLLDERAFGLETRTSEPFNLYWTIVQRAYMVASERIPQHDKVDDDGAFEPTLETLYRWAGLEQASDATNPFRIRDRFCKYLDLMIDKQLLEFWECHALTDRASPFRRACMTQARVKIGLPRELLSYLPDNAFIGGSNPFSHARFFVTETV